METISTNTSQDQIHQIEDTLSRLYATLQLRIHKK